MNNEQTDEEKIKHRIEVLQLAAACLAFMTSIVAALELWGWGGGLMAFSVWCVIAVYLLGKLN